MAVKKFAIPAYGYGMSFSEYGEALCGELQNLEVGVEYIAKIEKVLVSKGDYAPDEDLPDVEGFDLVLRKKKE
jgi:hypothetical protein